MFFVPWEILSYHIVQLEWNMSFMCCTQMLKCAFTLHNRLRGFSPKTHHADQERHILQSALQFQSTSLIRKQRRIQTRRKEWNPHSLWTKNKESENPKWKQTTDLVPAFVNAHQCWIELQEGCVQMVIIRKS